MNELRRFSKILEASEKYTRVRVGFDFDPVLSEETFDLHYGKLYKKYVDKAIAGDESDFNLGGVKLHTAYFEQIKEPTTPNNPFGESLILITEEFGDYKSFKEEFKSESLALQGSGWVYLSRSGKIKTIHNHKPVNDIALILDMWEHAFVLDYGSNKEKYIDNFWKIVNWEVVNIRLG